jgi:hypothetical protein
MSSRNSTPETQAQIIADDPDEQQDLTSLDFEGLRDVLRRHGVVDDDPLYLYSDRESLMGLCHCHIMDAEYRNSRDTVMYTKWPTLYLLAELESRQFTSGFSHEDRLDVISCLRKHDQWLIEATDVPTVER